MALLTPRGSASLLLGILIAAAGGAEPPADRAGLRIHRGRYATIVTDHPDVNRTADLTASVDAAVPQWCRFWGQPLDRLDGWQMTVYVMTDQADFRRRGLLPKTIPEFPHGFQAGTDAWAMAQPSTYFQRHLVLHECFHGFAAACFGGLGPTWFAEGTAEMMATHRGSGDSVVVPTIPADRDAVPYWGRFKRIAQRRREDRLPTLESVLDRQTRLYRDVEPYAWSWSAAVLLTMYPEYLRVLKQISENADQPPAELTRSLRRALAADWPLVQARWRLLLCDFDYGFDAARHRVELRDPADAETPSAWDGRPRVLKIAADRGWQSAGVIVAAGTQVQCVARGQVILDNQPRPWVSYPEGVTVRYHQGHPLGRLLAVAVPIRNDPAAGTFPNLDVLSMGSRQSLTIQQDSWLLFRVNDSPGGLTANSGHYDVKISGKAAAP